MPTFPLKVVCNGPVNAYIMANGGRAVNSGSQTGAIDSTVKSGNLPGGMFKGIRAIFNSPLTHRPPTARSSRVHARARIALFPINTCSCFTTCPSDSRSRESNSILKPEPSSRSQTHAVIGKIVVQQSRTRTSASRQNERVRDVYGRQNAKKVFVTVQSRSAF